jgi:hypothetical protein
MRSVAIILAACALMAADLRAEGNIDRQRSAWPKEQESRPTTPMSEWLPSLSGSKQDADAATPSESEPEPATADPAPPPRKQQPRKAAPEPEPEPKLTRKEQEAEDRWWKEVGDPAVSAFSRCLAQHVVDETSSGRESSYPDFVTTAMNSRCSREFAAMAQLILDRHGEDNFARIARKLITTKFVPAVKQVVEVGPPELAQPEDDKPALEAEMRRSKEAMFGCLVDEADRLAASSAAAAERVADRVIAACQTTAEIYFGKLEQLYPGATGGKAAEKSAAILEASYRPAIIERIASMRETSFRGPSVPGASVTGDRVGAGTGGGKADAEPASRKRQEAFRPKAISPAGELAPGYPAPASSRP